MGGGGVLEREGALVATTPKELFIGGSWVPARAGRRFGVEDPARGEVLCDVADAGVDDAQAAFDAACRAQDGWAATPPRERSEILRAGFAGVTAASDDLALLMTLEMGKPLADARAEVAYGADFLRWFSEEAVRIDGRYNIAPDGGSRIVTMRQPVGPCLLVTPWNFPLAMGTRKIAPALAAGCTMVVKPAHQTPLTTLALAKILAAAGVPDGVVNVVTTTSPAEVAGAILGDERLAKVSFTGSTAVGAQLAESAGRHVLRVSLELGGNAPFLVFDDADLDAAVDAALVAKMRNMGEACTAANRFLVQSPLLDAFTERLTARMAALRVGRGTDPGVEVGPLIDERQRAKVARLVDGARDEGASVLCGGRALEGAGYFYAPTVLSGVGPESAVANEEIFGPVAPVTGFGSDAEGIALANRTEHGLVAYAFVRDVERALRIAESLACGMVGVNRGLVSNAAAPFGGVKRSGIGREGGREGIEEYVSVKYVAIDRPSSDLSRWS